MASALGRAGRLRAYVTPLAMSEANERQLRVGAPRANRGPGWHATASPKVSFLCYRGARAPSGVVA